MALTVDHIHKIVTAVDAGWSPAELLADINSGLDHFGLASINAPIPTAFQPDDTFLLSAPTEEKVVGKIPSAGFYNAQGEFEPEYDDEPGEATLI